MENKATKITEQAGEILSSIGTTIAEVSGKVADAVADEYKVVKKSG